MSWLHPSVRTRRACLIGILAIHAGLAWAGRAPGVLTGQDDANYLVLGQSLRHLDYRDEFLVDAPLHRRFPPGYPAFLAVLGLLPGDPAALAIAANVILSTATIAVGFALMRPAFGDGIALAAIGVAALNPYQLDLAGLPRSEMLFAFLSVASLWAATRAQSRRSAALAAGLAIAAALVRAVGVTLVLALGLAWLLQRRGRRVAALAAVSAVTVGAWLAFSFAEPDSTAGWSYAADLAGPAAARGETPPGVVTRLARRVASNVPMYGGAMIPGLFPLPLSGSTSVDNVAASLVVTVGLGTGAVVMITTGAALVPIYLAGYLALLTVWPYQAERYLVPLLVLIIPLTIGGLAHLARRWRERAAGLVLAGCVLLVGGYAAVLDAEFLQRQAPCSTNAGGFPAGPCVTPNQASFFDALAWVRDSVPPDAVFFTAKPEPLYYYTGRRSLDVRPVAPEDTDLWKYLRDRNAEWILLGSLQFRDWTQFPRRLLPGCGRLALERFFPPHTYLMRVLPDTAPPQTAMCAALRAIDPDERTREMSRERPR